MSSNHTARREPSSKEVTGAGKKDGGKSSKKADKDKGKSAKEEAREVQLREEAYIREKVMVVKNNLSAMLKALGEMAIANPVFTHSQLPSLLVRAPSSKFSMYHLELRYIFERLDPIILTDVL
ncbi:hypothetical protein FXO37_11914 [Capsicum annuum]|nr:hypothetical protein FXO37_11914 [Capsicum annuum]